MKILLINTNDSGGGAAIATYRLFMGLKNEGLDVAMLVQNKATSNYQIIAPEGNISKLWAILAPTLDQLPVKRYKKRTRTLFSPAWITNAKILKMIEAYAPDVVHLHWITGGMLGISALGKIKFPIVWSLHDMWAFTGGCHYDDGCEAYQMRCGNCKVLGSSRNKDLSTKVFQKKQKIFQKRKMTIVSLSGWLNKCARRSHLLKDHRHVVLPNPIDTTIFKPFNKKQARELWRLPQDKKLILFGAMEATSDPRKGFKELHTALQSIALPNVEVVVFGSTEPPNPPDFGHKAHYLGQLSDDISLVTLYSAADVMVVPSLQENLSNTIMESLACGTPVVAFDIGGNGDMIDHQENGYLAKPYDTKDLSKGIKWILTNTHYDQLRKKARDKILREFDSKYISRRYIELYKDVIDSSSN